MVPQFVAIPLAVVTLILNILVAVLYKSNTSRISHKILFILFVIGILVFFASLSWAIL